MITAEITKIEQCVCIPWYAPPVKNRLFLGVNTVVLPGWFVYGKVKKTGSVKSVRLVIHITKLNLS